MEPIREDLISEMQAHDSNENATEECNAELELSMTALTHLNNNTIIDLLPPPPPPLIVGIFHHPNRSPNQPTDTDEQSSSPISAVLFSRERPITVPLSIPKNHVCLFTGCGWSCVRTSRQWPFQFGLEFVHTLVDAPLKLPISCIMRTGLLHKSGLNSNINYVGSSHPHSMDSDRFVCDSLPPFSNLQPASDMTLQI